MLVLDKVRSPEFPADCAHVSQGASESPTVHTAEIDGGLPAREPKLWNDWQELFATAGASIFQHPDFVLGETTAANKSVNFPGQVVVQLGSDPLAAALIPSRLSFRRLLDFSIPGSFLGYRLAGGKLLGEAGSDQIGDFIRTVADVVRSSRADLILIEDLEQDSPLTACVDKLRGQGWLAFYPKGTQARLKIRLPESPEEYWKSFSSKTRNTFRRKRKKIGDARLIRVTNPEQVPEFLEQAHRISQNTWQTQRLGLRIQNNEDDRRSFGFLAEHGALRSYLLQVDGRPVAFLVGNQFHGYFNYEEVGYDREFANLSPGQVLLLEVLDDLFAENTPQWFDFGAGDADYKRQFANVTSTSGTVWLVKPGLSRRMKLLGIRATRACATLARKTLKETGLFQRLRQWHRGGGSSPVASQSHPESTTSEAAEKE